MSSKLIFKCPRWRLTCKLVNLMMGVPRLPDISSNSWKKVCSYVDRSVVFIDGGAAECLHWCGGVLLLLDSGAVAVKEFSSFEGGLAEQSKAVFIISSWDPYLTLKIVHDIIKNSKFRQCVVLTSADETVLTHGYPDGGRSINVTESGRGVSSNRGLEQQLQTWMGDKICIATVVYLPIFFCNICSFVFVTPPFAGLFPALPNHPRNNSDSKFDKVNTNTVADLTFTSLPLNRQVQIKQLVSNCNTFLEELNAREDIFSIGLFSRIISTELEQLMAARNRRKMASNKVSLIFIDRTLDLTSSASHDFKTMLDKIICLLPSIPKHTNDVAVDMSFLSSNKPNVASLVPGCLACLKPDTTYSLIDSMIMNKPQECILEINRLLGYALTKLGLSQGSVAKVSRVNADMLESQLMTCRNSPEIMLEHCGILQFASSVVQTLRHEFSSKLDTLLGVEKGLLQTLAELKPSTCISRLIQIIKERNTRDFMLEDILVLLIFLYSLVGDGILADTVEVENNLKAVLADAFLEDSTKLSPQLKTIVGEEINELSVHNTVEYIFCALHAVCKARENLRKYRLTYDGASSVQPVRYVSVIKQILDDVYDPLKQELVDLDCKTAGLKDVLKSGLGLFMNVNKPRPSDNKTLIVFIVGGSTASEAKEIMETVMARSSSTQVIVGSTRLLLPKDCLQMLLMKNQ